MILWFVSITTVFATIVFVLFLCYSLFTTIYLNAKNKKELLMKKIKTFIITITIGAIGSAFWELLLKPMFLLFSEYVIAHCINFFSDSFYESITRGISLPYLNTFIYVLMLFAMSILFVPIIFTKLYSEEKKKISLFSFPTSFYLFCFLIVYSDMCINLAAYHIAQRTLSNIEIVAPYISDKEYKILKSDFYLIDSKNDYLDLTSRITLIMEQNDLDK